MDPTNVDLALQALDRATSENSQYPRLSPVQLASVRGFIETLGVWSRRMSLISTADPLQLVQLHILDSLSVSKHLPPSVTLADIGSGPGFPGIPLAIADPSSQVVLVESRRKKANFLREAKRCAKLNNVEVLEGRAEECRDRCFGAIISRAVGSVGELLEIGARLLEPSGIAVSMRGPGGASDEIEDRRYLPPELIEYRIAGDRRRYLLLYRKI